MPVYEYRCKGCYRTHEFEHGFHDERPTSCPACGGELARVFHPVGLVFKGSGFHRTDYSGESRSESAPTEPKAAESKPSEGKSSEATTSEAKSGEPKKPAADTKPKSS